MYQKKTENKIRCPLEYCLSLMSGKWKFRIICVLSDQEFLRYQDIKKELEDISDSVLSLSLKEMTESGLITRRSFDEVPPRVVYGLTDLGMSVTPLMKELCKWSVTNFDWPTCDMLSRCSRCEITSALQNKGQPC